MLYVMFVFSYKDNEDEGGNGNFGPFGRTSTFSFGRSVTQSRVVMPDGTVSKLTSDHY
jgi:hypothetical protein